MNTLMGYQHRNSQLWASDLPGAVHKRGKKSNAWFTACQTFCVFQVGAGAILSVTSFMFLFSFARVTGLIASAILITVGLMGFLGARIRSRALLNFHAVGAIIALVMLFDIVSMTARDKTVDCALAELHLRTKALHESLTSSRESAMFQAVYNRLNEMEEMLSNTEQSVMTTVRSSVDKLHMRVQDTRLLADKMEALRRHAERFIAGVHNNANLTQEVVNTLDADLRADISARIEKAHKVLQRIEQFERSADKSTAISFQEYEQLLHTLTEVITKQNPSGLLHTPMQQQQEMFRLRNALPDMAAVIGRLMGHREEQDSAASAMDAMWQEREERRSTWDEHFADIVDSHFRNLPSLDVLGDMPEHCMKETVANKVMLLLGSSIMVLQSLTVFFALNTLFSIPPKLE